MLTKVLEDVLLPLVPVEQLMSHLTSPSIKSKKSANLFLFWLTIYLLSPGEFFGMQDESGTVSNQGEAGEPSVETDGRAGSCAPKTTGFSYNHNMKLHLTRLQWFPWPCLCREGGAKDFQSAFHTRLIYESQNMRIILVYWLLDRQDLQVQRGRRTPSSVMRRYSNPWWKREPVKVEKKIWTISWLQSWVGGGLGPADPYEAPLLASPVGRSFSFKRIEKWFVLRS